MSDRPLTLFDARQILAKYATDFDMSINQALDRIYSDGNWPGLVKELDLGAYIENGILTLPSGYKNMVAVRVDGLPCDIIPVSFEYSHSGPGEMLPFSGIRKFVDLGPVLIESAGDYPVERRQYKVLATMDDTSTVTGLVKREFRPLVDDSDYIFPGNITALKHALMAVNYEDNASLAEAEAAWSKCFMALNKDSSIQRVGVTHTMAPKVSGAGTHPVRGMY